MPEKHTANILAAISLFNTHLNSKVHCNPLLNIRLSFYKILFSDSEHIERKDGSIKKGKFLQPAIEPRLLYIKSIRLKGFQII